jgi:5-methylcytosine-specific restriction endonuclease McrA
MSQFKMASLFKTFLSPPLDVTPKETKSKRKRKPKKPVTEIKPVIPSKKKKKPIPIALREQVWIHKMGRVFEGKCPVTWCQNTITVFDFQSGHNIPESKGGKTDLENLIPLCGRCNLSMGNQYTIDEWSKMSEVPVKTVVEVPKKKGWWCW